jgi:hypothetical protein
MGSAGLDLIDGQILEHNFPFLLTGSVNQVTGMMCPYHTLVFWMLLADRVRGSSAPTTDNHIKVTRLGPEAGTETRSSVVY